MKTKIFSIWYQISSSYWFIPGVMLILAIGLSFLMVFLDNKALETGWIESFDWLYANKPNGARSVLSTIAGSMITVAGVVFSITIVALTLASTQFGPRLLGNFMRDKGNQFVLGTFIATFVYSLLILRTIRSADEGNFVPNLSINLSVLLSIFSLGVLIYFIHHTAESIRAHNVINSAYIELKKSIESIFPEMIGQSLSQNTTSWQSPMDNPEKNYENRESIFIKNSGYIRIINNESLMDVSKINNLVISLNFTPGEYIIENNCIADVWYKEEINEDTICTIQNSFILGIERTSEQDIEFAIDQLVEIALRALSPGINDPFTAINCIDRLGAGLCMIAERKIPSSHRYDRDNELRVISKTPDFNKYIDRSFNQIRNYGKNDPEVMNTVLKNLNQIQHRVVNKEDKKFIILQAEKILNACSNIFEEKSDLLEIKLEFQKIKGE